MGVATQALLVRMLALWVAVLSSLGACTAEAKAATEVPVLEIRGVIPYAVRSLSSVNARYLKGSADTLDGSLLFPEATRAPETLLPRSLNPVRVVA